MDGVGREIGGFQDGGTHVHLSGELVISLVLSHYNKNLNGWMDQCYSPRTDQCYSSQMDQCYSSMFQFNFI